MIYDVKRKILRLSVSEAVTSAYVRYSAPSEGEGAEHSIRLTGRSDKQLLALTEADLSSAKAVKDAPQFFLRAFALGDLSCEMVGEAETVYENGVLAAMLFRAETDEDPDALSEGALRFLRGVAFLTASLVDWEKEIVLRYEIRSIPYGKTASSEEKPERSAMRRFWKRVTDALLRDSHHEAERVSKRLPTFLRVPFPYGEAREGQKDMMSAVYAAARHGETLFAVAPTGTGKTMATLFPALRALGARYADKVFYLTPKTTSAQAALDGVEHLRAKGALVRAVHLGAKERLCSRRRECGSCLGCPRNHTAKRMEEAVELLLREEKASVREADVLRVSAACDVCPHELSLSYSLYADVVVGDYNYLFDPKSFLRRYFEKGGEYIFLIDEGHNLPDRAREMYSASFSGELFARLRTLFAPSARLTEVARRLEEAFTKAVDALLKDTLRTDEEGNVTGFTATTVLPVAFLNAVRKCLDIFMPEVRPRGAKEDEKSRLLRQTVYELAAAAERAEAFDEHFTVYALREGESRTLRVYCIDPSSLIAARLAKGKSAVFFSATFSPIEYYRSVLCGRHPASVIEVPSPFDVGAVCVGVVDSISVRASAREDTLPEIAKLIVSAMRPRKGNYMVFCPSFHYLEKVAEAFHRLTPKTPIAVQKRNMSEKERKQFLAAFSAENRGHFVGFCVTGGIYAEGIDLVGERLIGAVIIGMGLPQVSAEREVTASYYQSLCDEGKEYAYLYPALNRIMQAAGRVIRTEKDRGVIVLADDRLRDPVCRKIFPSTWKRLKYVRDRASLGEHIAAFWEQVDVENDNQS